MWAGHGGELESQFVVEIGTLEEHRIRRTAVSLNQQRLIQFALPVMSVRIQYNLN